LAALEKTYKTKAEAKAAQERAWKIINARHLIVAAKLQAMTAVTYGHQQGWDVETVYKDAEMTIKKAEQFLKLK